MDAIIRFLQDTGFYLFSQDGNWRCLIMLGIACLLMGVMLLVDHIRREREEKAKKQDAADTDKE